eukprot:COSAG01_NODE_1636_length_9660_cov_10.575881_4_plen_394_part_00
MIAAGMNTTQTPLSELYLTSFYCECKCKTAVETYIHAAVSCVCNTALLHVGGITVLSTVGFGDITPQTWQEKVFSIVAELIGCMIFATMIGGLGGIFAASKLDEQIDDRLEEVRYMYKHEKKMAPKRVLTILKATQPLIRKEITQKIDEGTKRIFTVAQNQSLEVQTASKRALLALKDDETEKGREKEVRKLMSVLEALKLKVSLAEPIVKKWYRPVKDERGDLPTRDPMSQLYDDIESDAAKISDAWNRRNAGETLSDLDNALADDYGALVSDVPSPPNGDPSPRKNQAGSATGIVFQISETVDSLRALGMKPSNAQKLVRHLYNMRNKGGKDSTCAPEDQEGHSNLTPVEQQNAKIAKMETKVDKLADDMTELKDDMIELKDLMKQMIERA